MRRRGETPEPGQGGEFAMIRLMRSLAVLFACAALAACGGTNEFEVKVERSPDRVARPLLEASTAEADVILPGLKVARSRTSDREIRYVFPGSGKYEPASILFRLDPADDGNATLVHAVVEVPRITANIHGEMKTFDQNRIAGELRAVIDGMARGDSDAETTKKLSRMIIAMAIVTDDVQRDKALAMISDKGAILRNVLDQVSGDLPVDDSAPDNSNPTEYDTPPDASEEFSPERDHKRKLSFEDDMNEDPAPE
jgi:hypothetical protein